ncbi:hypothetical protein ASF21_12685 [Arthrobacter sp. Leaf234]|nr:hypothetical protein ASF21_12685 [Arthrobacter sp. Leaf234]
MHALREAVLASDGDCPGETAEGENEDGEVLIVCDEDTAVRWFPNEEELTTGKLGMAIGLSGAGAFLTGPNWIIQGTTDELADLRESMGGELTVL